MRERPLVVRLVTWFLCCVPPFGAMGLLYFSRYSPFQLLSVISWQLYFLAVACYGTAYGVWKVRKWGFFLFFAFAATVAVLDGYSAHLSRFNHTFWYIIDALLITTGVTLFLQRKVYEPYFNPQIRWWERASRHRVDLNAKISSASAETSTLLLDISETGCFAASAQEHFVNRPVTISFSYQGSEFRTEALLIRHSETPRGTGFRFTDTSRDNRKILRSIISQLEQLSKNKPVPDQAKMAS